MIQWLLEYLTVLSGATPRADKRNLADQTTVSPARKASMSNFQDSEFDCRDGTKYPEHWGERLAVLKDALETIRSTIGNKPIRINSAFRTVPYNKKIGGATNSMHTKGIAVDISVKGMKPSELYRSILKLIDDKKIPDGGLGLYTSWVHYDIRSILGFGLARWRG